MKTMKQIITTALLSAVFLIGFAGGALGQTNTSLQVEAELVGWVDVTHLHDLEFDLVLQNSNKSINPVTGAVSVGGGGINGLQTSGEQRGAFSFISAPKGPLTVSFTVDSVLTDVDDNTLAIDFGGSENSFQGLITDSESFGDISTDDYSGKAIVNGFTGEFGYSAGTGEETYTASLTEADNSGTLYLVVGGQVLAGASQPISNYAGDMVLTVSIPN